MVQWAIKEDLLWYQKTLLVWNKFTNQEANEKSNFISQPELKQKLEKVKRALIEVLAENRNGISLA